MRGLVVVGAGAEGDGACGEERKEAWCQRYGSPRGRTGAWATVWLALLALLNLAL